MRLNHPGIYRIVGEQFELLAVIEGEIPLCTISKAILINDLVAKGEFTILDSESLEVQLVNANPSAFVFIEYEYSSIAELPLYRRSVRGTKMPIISDDEMEEFTKKYIDDVRKHSNATRTKAYIMSKTNFSLPQINVIVLQIAKKLARNGY